MSKVLIFGAGKIAEVAYYHLTNDSPHDVVAFTIDQEFIVAKELFNLPIVPFEEIEKVYLPDQFNMLVAVGYQDLNKMRAVKYNEAKEKGYELISYISSRASNFGKVDIGDNCLILENQTIQPGAKIGDNVIIWSGNHIGHHSTIGDHCFITSHVVISGGTVIEPYCFIGVNATLGHAITIGEESIIGAGSLITKNTQPGSVYIIKGTEPFKLNSSQFLRLVGGL